MDRASGLGPGLLTGQTWAGNITPTSRMLTTGPLSFDDERASERASERENMPVYWLTGRKTPSYLFTYFAFTTVGNTSRPRVRRGMLSSLAMWTEARLGGGGGGGGGGNRELGCVIVPSWDFGVHAFLYGSAFF